MSKKSIDEKDVYTLKLPRSVKKEFQELLNREKESTGRAHGEVIHEMIQVYCTYKVENASFKNTLVELDRLKQEIKSIENKIKEKRA